MGFLEKLLNYKKVCIQCHNNPDSDAIASAFGVYRYLQKNGIEASIVYGGPQKAKKNAILTLIKECNIPISYVDTLPECDLLLLVDCQYGKANVEMFPAEQVMLIDHHIRTVEEKEEYLIKSDYQSCSTIIYELLLEEGYDVEADEDLTIALLFGLYIDTSCLDDLFKSADKTMWENLFHEQPVLERLMKSSMSVAELMIAGDAMLHHYFDVDRRYAIIEALKCDQSVLGIIGDFIIRVDVVFLSVTYTETGTGYQISIRSCHEDLPANEIAAYICKDIGGGGGHRKKAGGQIHKEKMESLYKNETIFEVINQRICQYISN
jgi:nanoRNase/pAp phosphatase (c-di-AMP/oligoRNAs hydrolase)